MFGRFFRDTAAGWGLAAFALAIGLAGVAWSDAAGPASDAINDGLLVMASGFAVSGAVACALAVWSALRSAGPRLKVKPVRHPQFSLTQAQVRYFVATVVNDGQATATRCWPQVELDKSLRKRTHVPAQPGVWRQDFNFSVGRSVVTKRDIAPGDITNEVILAFCRDGEINAIGIPTGQDPQQINYRPDLRVGGTRVDFAVKIVSDSGSSKSVRLRATRLPEHGYNGLEVRRWRFYMLIGDAVHRARRAKQVRERRKNSGNIVVTVQTAQLRFDNVWLKMSFIARTKWRRLKRRLRSKPRA